jgi:hypothetical protein
MVINMEHVFESEAIQQGKKNEDGSGSMMSDQEILLFDVTKKESWTA